MRSALRRLAALRSRLLVFLRCLSEYGYDARRFVSWSALSSRLQDLRQLESVIQAQAHVMEKGLALPFPRPSYGQAMLSGLIQNLATYRTREYSTERHTYQAAVAVIHAYISYHVALGIPMDDLTAKIAELSEGTCGDGGVRAVSRPEWLRAGGGSFREMMASRCSVRMFADTPVDTDRIMDAISIAKRTPSVCNRQPWHVYVLGEQAKQELLQLATGCRGFGDTVGRFLLVATDIRDFFDLNERYQPFVDGGMFSMSLLQALHHVGLGACALNWSVESDRDRDLHAGLSIPDYHLVVLIVAVGNVPETFSVARSSRRPVESFVSMLP